MADASITLTAVDKTKQAIDSAKSNMDGLGAAAGRVAVALAGFGAAAAAAAVAWSTLVSHSQAVDAFNDLRDATGASIENISALDRVARETGGTFQGMSTALTKFNGVLNKVGDDTQQAGIIFKALGLDADELKKMDPAEALLKTATAFQKFELDGNAARAMQALFGKSVREVAPFLKDLAEKGELVATTSTKAAEQAEEFNKALYRMQANSTDTARKLVGDLLPAITSILNGFQSIPGKINLMGLAGDVIDASKTLKALEARQKDMFTFNWSGNLDAEIAKAKAQLEAAKVAFKGADKGRPADKPEDDPKPKPSLPDTKPPKLAKAPDHFADNFINQLITEYANLTGAMSKTDEVTRKLDLSTEKFSATERARALGLAGQIDAEKTKAILLAHSTTEMTRYGAAIEAAEAAYSRNVMGLIHGNQAQAFELTLIGKTAEEVERLRFERELSVKVIEAEGQVMDDRNQGLITEIEMRERLLAIGRLTADARSGRGDIVAQTEARLRDPLAGYTDAFNEYEKTVGRVALSTKNMMTNAFSGMEDALVSFAKTGKLDFKSLADSMISDMIRIQIRQSITGPMASGGMGGLLAGLTGLFGGGLDGPAGGGGGGIGTLGGGIDATAIPTGDFARMDRLSFDGGGYTGDGVRSGGLDGKGGFMAMMHPQETVLDHTKGQGAGSSFSPVTTINVAGGMASGEVYSTVQKALAENNRQWAEHLKRQGVFA